MLLVVHAHLRLSMLAALNTTHASAVHLRSLESLQVRNLQWVEALAGEHLLRNKNLSLWKLYELRLSGILKVTDGADGLIHGAPGPMSWLERRGIGGLIHVEITHVLGVVGWFSLLLGLLGLLGLRLSPVTVEVAGLASAMALATMALAAATLEF